MFVYVRGKWNALVNLDHAEKLTIQYSGLSGCNGWSVVAYLAGRNEPVVLSEHGSGEAAENALLKICDALKAGFAVYDAQSQTEFISSESE